MDEIQKKKSIYELQSRLLTLSRRYETARVIPDGIYGSETRDAVADFQERAGLPITGVTDYATWTAIYEAEAEVLSDTAPPMMISPFETFFESGVMRAGDRSASVYIVQVMLEELSRLFEYEEAVIINGDFDSATEAAVKHIQQSLALPDTGEIDKATWNELSLLYNRLIRYPR